MLSKETKVTIKIPRQLYRQIKKVNKGTGFNSVTDFVVFVLRSLVVYHKKKSSKILTKVKKDLKNLGYF